MRDWTKRFNWSLNRARTGARWTLLPVAVSALFLDCTGTPSAEHPEPSENATASDDAVGTAKDGMNDWSEVEPLTTSAQNKRAPSRRKGTLAVSSDPQQHGEQLTFQFTVNGVRLNGDFSMLGGSRYRFSIPSGTVLFTTDECSLGEQGFELEPGATIPIGCRLTTDGDCCQVELPVEGESTAADGAPEDSAAKPAE